MADFSDAEKVDYMFKKIMGKPTSDTSKAFFEEPSLPARASVFSNKQIWSQDIPAEAPRDLVLLTDSDKDDSGSTLAGSTTGNTSTTTGNAMIKRYLKVPMVYVSGSGTPGAYKLDALQDTIPFNYDSQGSYAYTLYKNDGSTQINDGVGEWVIDTEAGVLTFYHSISGVSSGALPKISFYRYVGRKGLTGSFTQLSDTPATLNASTVLKINDLGTAIETSITGNTNFDNIVSGNVFMSGNLYSDSNNDFLIKSTNRNILLQNSAYTLTLPSSAPGNNTFLKYDGSDYVWAAGGGGGGGGAVATYTNGTNNYLITSSGSDSINSEENLQFDGERLTITGNLDVSSTIKYGTDTLNTWGSLNNYVNVLKKSVTLLNLNHSDFNGTGNISIHMPVTTSSHNLFVGTTKTFILSGVNSNLAGARNIKLYFPNLKLHAPGTSASGNIYMDVIGQGVNLMWSGDYWFIINGGAIISQ